MKILIVRTFPSILNFKQYNVQEIGLAKALVRKGYECGIVFYNGKNKDDVEYIPVNCDGKIRNITVYKLHGFNILKNGFFPSLRKVTKEYDVIQVHEYDQITSWLYYAWSKKPVVIYHGPYYDEFNKGYNFKCKIFDNVFLRIRHNRKVPCLTKSYAAEEFLRNKGFENTMAVGVGLDTDNFSVQVINEEEKIEIEKNKFTIIYVGKIEERRNSLFLGDVAQEITSRYDDVQVVIVGNGEKVYKDTFIARIEPLIKLGKVKYYLSATQVQLADLYQKASIMLFPSNYEIFGMVILEAVYFNLPIISSKNGGADILLSGGDKGTVVNDFSKETWLSAIEYYYNIWKFNNGRNIKSINSERDNLLWDSICKKMIEVYEETIGRDVNAANGIN